MTDEIENNIKGISLRIIFLDLVGKLIYIDIADDDPDLLKELGTDLIFLALCHRDFCRACSGIRGRGSQPVSNSYTV
jgi:hypothetical protein